MHFQNLSVAISLLFAMSTTTTFSQAPEPNYEESLVPAYTLLNPLVFADGTPVKSPADWAKRREELLRLFETHVYGKTPVGKPVGMHVNSRKKVSGFLDGKATMEEIRIYFSPGQEGPFLDLLVIKPAGIPAGGVPTFLGLNFDGNQSIHPSPEITISGSWMRESKDVLKDGFVVDHKATEKSRGSAVSRWPVEKIIASGCALATFYYGDIDPDVDDGFENGIHALFGKPGEGEWGSIGAWAWGASRAMDYLTTDPAIDQKRVALFGHSRLGKTALWGGAQDERFSLVISNNSGCGGAALSKRCFGERVGRINRSFPHWFSDSFNEYNENEAALPVDQHQLIALIAPRMVYVASAEEDRWADPKGEFLGAKLAEPVYELLGQTGLGAKEQPPLNTPVGTTVRYHVRTGIHDVTDFDWEQYIKAIKSL